MMSMCVSIIGSSCKLNDVLRLSANGGKQRASVRGKVKGGNNRRGEIHRGHPPSEITASLPVSTSIFSFELLRTAAEEDSKHGNVEPGVTLQHHHPLHRVSINIALSHPAVHSKRSPFDQTKDEQILKRNRESRTPDPHPKMTHTSEIERRRIVDNMEERIGNVSPACSSSRTTFSTSQIGM